MTPTIYQCPRTQSTLFKESDVLKNHDGTVSFEINEEVPVFLKYPPVESDGINSELVQANSLAQQQNWKNAISEVYGEWGYVYPNGRDQWIELLAINKNSCVLEIGCGMGQFTSILSEKCDRLYAMEVVPLQAQFALKRCRQDGCENIEFACAGDDCLLPYQDNSFDWVVMNLVFEWCSNRNDPDAGMTNGQKTMLNEMYRVLKPGGKLYLQTKNRYALRYLIGKRDEHCFLMRWGNALPRPIMSLILKLKGKDRPAGVLHSHNSLKKMMINTGFSSVDSFWAAPEMRRPQWCIPTDSASIRAARAQPGFLQGEFKITRLIMSYIPSRFVKYFSAGHQMIATKDQK